MLRKRSICLFCHDPLEQDFLGLCFSCYSFFSSQSVSENCCVLCHQPMLSEEKFCYDCRGHSWSFSELRGLFPYQDGKSALIRLYKFGPEPRLSFFLSQLLAPYLIKPGILVPVPALRKNYLTRGWDPVLRLVKDLGKALNWPVQKLLIRQSSKIQKKLSRENRFLNAQTAFTVRKTGYKIISGTYWLVDDVVTTGATIQACAKLLKGLGAEDVKVACLALH